MDNKILTKEELIKALIYTDMHYHSIPQEYKADKDVFLAALKGPSYCPLKFADKTIQDDDTMVIAAINADASLQNGTFEYASDRLKKDKKLALLALQKSSNAIFYVAEILKDDEDIVNSGLMHRYDFFSSVSDRIKNNKDIMLKAVQKSSANYRFVSPELKQDRDIALETLKSGHKDIYNELGGDEIKEPFKLLNILDNSKDISDFSWMNDEPDLSKDKRLISLLVPFSIGEIYKHLDDSLNYLALKHEDSCFVGNSLRLLRNNFL